jgi:TorA maturation chaperone TorD
MAACIGQVRMQGLVQMTKEGDWAEDRRHPLYYLVKVAKVALPLYPQFGTEPNGYYIPPRWVPRNYLFQMFGPGVDAAWPPMRPVAPADGSPPAFPSRRQSSSPQSGGPKIRDVNLNGKTWSLYDDTVTGHDKSGKEAVKVSCSSPSSSGRAVLNSIEEAMPSCYRPCLRQPPLRSFRWLAYQVRTCSATGRAGDGQRRRLCPNGPRRLAGAATERLVAVERRDLASAYRKVFTFSASPDCPLNECAYSAKHTYQEVQELADIAGFYTAFGLELAGERPDELTAELEFCGLLALKEAVARERSMKEQARVSHEGLELFLHDHLGRWATARRARVAHRRTEPPEPIDFEECRRRRLGVAATSCNRPTSWWSPRRLLGTEGAV